MRYTNYYQLIVFYYTVSLALIVVRDITGAQIFGYFIYGIVFTPLIYIILTKNSYAKFNITFIPYLFLIISIIISFTFQIGLFGIYQAIIVLTATFPFCISFRGQNLTNSNDLLKSVSILAIVGFLLIYGKNILTGGPFWLGEGILSSKVQIGTESNVLSFVFGLLFAHFLFKGQKSLALINLIFVFLSFKRIVVLASIVVAIYYLFFNKKQYKKVAPYIAVSIASLFLLLISLLVNSYFDSLIKDYFGVSPGQFTSGRTSFYGYVLPQISSFNFELLFGKGFGYATSLVNTYFGHRLHSDILKLYIELGFLGFLGFIYLLFRYSKNILATITIYIYFFTDNTLTYAFVIVLYLVIQNIASSYSDK